MLYGEYKKREQRHVDSLFRYAEMLGFGELLFKFDHETGLHAIIALHSNKRGPAIGGCRVIHYDHADDAIVDAMRLAQMMSYKAAVCNLPNGGAKSVIMKPKEIKDRQAFFHSFGQFVNEQQGRYVTAVDSGTTPEDMDAIAKATSYVTCTTFGGYAGDPAPFTALGVRRGIEAAVKFKLKKDNLKGLHIAIQGAGHVGFHLAKEVIALGAHVTMTDVNKTALQHAAQELGVTIYDDPETIYGLECDVFAPCALGAILNLQHIHQLETPIVAGSANNQ